MIKRERHDLYLIECRPVLSNFYPNVFLKSWISFTSSKVPHTVVVKTHYNLIFEATRRL